MTAVNYILISILVSVFAAMFIRGSRAWLSYSFIGLLAVLGLYVFDMLRLPTEVRWYMMLPVNYEALLILSLSFVTFFGVGELIGYDRGYRNPLPPKQVVYADRWEKIAVGLFSIGFIGLVIFVATSGGFNNFYGATHGSGANFSSAYLYRLPDSIYTAALILLTLRVKGEKLGRIAQVVLVLALVILLFDLVTQGKRGGVIRFALLISIPFITLDKITPRRVVLMVISAAFVMIFLIALPYIRYALTINSFTELGAAVDQIPLVSNGYATSNTVQLEGKHVVFASIVVAGGLDYPDPNYGFRWLFPFVNLVPRIFWPDKPYRYDFGNDFYDVARAESSLFIPDGSYAGGIAESFIEWSYAVIVVWFVMGLILGYIRGHTTARKSTNSIILFYSAIVFFVHFMLQDTIQGILSFMFLYGPFMVLKGIFQPHPRPLSILPQYSSARPLRHMP